MTREFTRRILSGDASFGNLTPGKISLMISHINFYTKKLNSRSTGQLFSFFYSKNTQDALIILKIPAKDINLTPRL